MSDSDSHSDSVSHANSHGHSHFHGESHSHGHAHSHADDHTSSVHSHVHEEHEEQHGHEYFQTAASIYDQMPGANVFADNVYTAIRTNVDVHKMMKSRNNNTEGDSSTLWKQLDVLDFGAGTGLISTRIAPDVHTVDAVDTSNEMLAQLTTKIQNGAKQQPPILQNINVHNMFVERAEQLNGKKYDIIICSMAAHHIKEIQNTIHLWANLLKPAGVLVIIDHLAVDDTHGFQHHFHGEAGTEFAKQSGVHHKRGFSKETIRSMYSQAGLGNTYFTQDFTLKMNIPAWKQKVTKYMEENKKSQDQTQHEHHNASSTSQEGDSGEQGKGEEFKILVSYGIKPVA